MGRGGNVQGEMGGEEVEGEEKGEGNEAIGTVTRRGNLLHEAEGIDASVGN